MDYVQGTFALIGLIISVIIFLSAIKWVVGSAILRRSSGWLIAFAVIASLQFIEFIYISFELYLRWPIMFKILDPILVLLPLCIYGHMRELQGDNIFSSKHRALAYLSPGLIILVLDLHLWVMPAEQQLAIIKAAMIDEDAWSSLAPYGNLHLSTVAMLCAYYLFKQFRNGYQGKSLQVRKWVRTIQVLLILTFTAITIRIIASEWFDYYFSMVYVMGPFAIYFIYSMLNFTVLPHDENSPIDASDASQPEKSKKPIEITEKTPQKSDAELEALKEMFNKLEQILTDGAFRDNELSLGNLAKACELTSHQASAAINQFSGYNFYEWVNQFRISAAKSALEESKKSVSSICYDVGFNSKSTFYSAFKKNVGSTPTEYRKSFKEEQIQDPL